MSELAKCPFCGGTAGIHRMPVIGTYFIRCDSCRIAATLNGADSPEQAVEAWNTRHVETCHDANTRFNAWVCSECDSTVLLMFDDYGEPTLNIDGTASIPNYCPNCGAKVVNK